VEGTLQSILANASMQNFSRPNTSTQLGNSGRCVTNIIYKHYGSPETAFWIMASLLVISLNAYCIYLSNNSNSRKTLYCALLNALMASNIFSGVVVHSIFAYLSQSNRGSCTLVTYFMACCVFNLMSTLLSITLITINRFMIVHSCMILQRRSFFRTLTENRTYFVYFSILTTSLAVTLIRVYFRVFGTAMINVIIVVLSLIIIGLLWNVHSKLKHTLTNRDGASPTDSESSPINCEMQRFKCSLRVLKLSILSMVLLWLPLVAAVTLTRVFSWQSSPTAISITAKLIWFRPVVDPIAYLLVAVKKRPVLTRAVVSPMKTDK